MNTSATNDFEATRIDDCNQREHLDLKDTSNLPIRPLEATRLLTANTTLPPVERMARHEQALEILRNDNLLENLGMRLGKALVRADGYVLSSPTMMYPQQTPGGQFLNVALEPENGTKEYVV
jgi:hypothetical protein